MRSSAMLRSIILFLLINSAALAASEQDLRDCRDDDLDRTIAGCTRIIEDRADTPVNRAIGYTNRGGAYHNKGLYDRALVDFDEAIRLNPKLAAAYNNRGATYSKKGLYDRALIDHDEAIRLSPNDARFRNNRGPTYQAKREFDRAFADFNEALRLDATLALAYSNRGFAYEDLGRKVDAIADYRKALLLDPSDKAATNGLKRLGAKAF